jgi:hypothetical protein
VVATFDHLELATVLYSLGELFILRWLILKKKKFTIGSMRSAVQVVKYKRMVGITKFLDFIHRPVFFKNNGRRTKSKNLVIPRVIHHRQNPLKSTREWVS